MPENSLPSTYLEFLREIASLSNETRLFNTEIGFEPLPIHTYLDGQTQVYLGCYWVEQNLVTGESILWHTYADGPDGYLADEPDEDLESNGGWPLDGDGNHFLQHGIDQLSWSLINTLDQALNGFLDENHAEGFCKGLDSDYCSALRRKLIEKLKPLAVLKCECGEFARTEISELEKQIGSVS